MSRQFKFRTWNVVGRCMVSDEGLHQDLGLTYPIRHPERYVLMQSTGMRDKNGVEIYEGDIVRGVTEYSGKANRGIMLPKTQPIRWSDEQRGWSAFPLVLTWPVEMSRLEVIGNIYENPALLDKAA